MEQMICTNPPQAQSMDFDAWVAEVDTKYLNADIRSVPRGMAGERVAVDLTKRTEFGFHPEIGRIWYDKHGAWKGYILPRREV